MRRPILLLCAALPLAVPTFQAPSTAEAAETARAPSAEAPAQEQRRVYHQTARPTYYRTYRPATRYRTYHYSYPRDPAYPTYRYYYAPPIVYPPTVYVEPAPVYVAPEPVYIEEEPVVVQQGSPVVVEQPTTVYAAPAAEPIVEDFGASFTLRFVGQNQSDADLAVETIRGATLLGAGGAIRFDLDNHWMIELALDVMAAENADGIKQLAVPASISVLAHLFPDSVIDPYGVAGLGIIWNEVDDPNLGIVEDYTQFEGHVGGGAELNLGRQFLITADLRAIFMQARPDRAFFVDSATGGGGVTVRNEAEAAADPAFYNEDPDRIQTGLQFLVGAGWRF